MKLKFKQQPYQYEAAMAVVKCFEGQISGTRKERVSSTDMFDEIFSNKKIELTPSDILKNVQQVQREQGLKVSTVIPNLNFTIEMETGTGKTYVYTQTMYELYSHYGWSKFIILVPSIAIREGVHKSLQITEEHFQELYGKKIRFFIYNTQNKSNLVNIKNFANTADIEVIIMNYQAFASKSKESKKIYQKLDSLQSEKPIDIIKRTRPVVIIDEPQRFGTQAEQLLPEFNPLFILRYSATHKQEFTKIYRLDAIDAYNQKLVKKIKVKGIEVLGNTGTNSYLFLDHIKVSTTAYPVAYIEYEVDRKTSVQKVLRACNEKDNLYELSGELQQYKGFVIKEINALKRRVVFTNGVTLQTGQAYGDVDEAHVRRIQIRETIKSHLEKERRLYPQGIKVLSLFFIDEVARYRLYDAANNPLKGEYAKIFEEEYAAAIAQKDAFEPEYNAYLEKFLVEEVHNGYFSIDKKGRMVDSVSSSAAEREESSDTSAYELIMKRKEQLLSLTEPTRFIFSHSALREGWDNPNVFQICTLKHSDAVISKRQEIGRGLRICVNNKGDRMDYSVVEGSFFDLNTLTVVASESYDDFARALQSEIVNSLSDRPVKLEPKVLENKTLTNAEGAKYTFDAQRIYQFMRHCDTHGYIDSELFVTEKAILAIEDGTLAVPADLTNFKQAVCNLLQGIYTAANFSASENEDATTVAFKNYKPNANFDKKEFQELWNRIKVKTVYEVNFDSTELIKKAVIALDANLTVKTVQISITTGEQADNVTPETLKEGTSLVKTKRTDETTTSLLGAVRYDIVGELAKATSLTRKTMVKILQEIKASTFAKFKVNPESFIKEAAAIINGEKAATLINNIVYTKTDNTYDDTIFTINDFKGSLSENILEVKKHIYDYIKTDSNVERKFAEELETGEIAVYAKLPMGFKIPTPVGNYNPDWAIVFDTADVKYVYFIAETKGSMESLQLRAIESQKIDYARKHFAALGHADIKYDVITSYTDLRQKILT